MRHLSFLALAAAVAVVVPQPLAAQPPPLDWASAQPIEINLSNFAFTPARFSLYAGAPYRLRFVNKASGGHDFSAKAFFAAATVNPEDRAAVQNGAVRLSGGQSAEVRLVAPAAGVYEAHCSHFMHASFGMKGQIFVQPAPGAAPSGRG